MYVLTYSSWRYLRNARDRDGMMITQTQAEALATAVARARTDWDRPGILTAIHAAAHLGDPIAIGAALYALASNREMRTPACLRLPGPHWTGTVVADRKPPTMCGEHPQHPTARCPDCARIQPGDAAAGAAAVRAALAASTRYVDDYHARMQRLRDEREAQA